MDSTVVREDGSTQLTSSAGPLLSIIVAAYNVEKYIDRCLTTLLCQSLDAYEVIVIDDGSTDGTPGILEAYAKDHPSIIKLIRQDNAGLSAARNAGIQAARGKYLGFVDADDFVDPDMYLSMVSACESSSADICVCGIATVAEGRKSSTSISLPFPESFGSSVQVDPRVLLAAKSYAWNKVYLRELFASDLSMRFPVGRYYEDSHLVYRLMHRANRIVSDPRKYYYYRVQREGAITKSIDERIFDIFGSCDAIRNYYEPLPGYTLHYQPVIERLCWLHIFVRMNTLRHAVSDELRSRYVSTAFDYMDSHFCGWSGRARSWTGKRFADLVKTSRLLAHLYLLTLTQWGSQGIRSADRLTRFARRLGRYVVRRPRSKPARAQMVRSGYDDAWVAGAASHALSELASVGAHGFLDGDTLSRWAGSSVDSSDSTSIQLGFIHHSALRMLISRRLHELALKRSYSLLADGEVMLDEYVGSLEGVDGQVRLLLRYYYPNGDECAAGVVHVGNRPDGGLSVDRMVSVALLPVHQQTVEAEWAGHKVLVAGNWKEYLDCRTALSGGTCHSVYGSLQVGFVSSP